MVNDSTLDDVLNAQLCIFIELARLMKSINNNLNELLNEKVKQQNRTRVCDIKHDIENGFSVITLLSKDRIAQKYFPGLVTLLFEMYSQLFDLSKSIEIMSSMEVKRKVKQTLTLRHFEI
jgi:hypothetical protein